MVSALHVLLWVGSLAGGGPDCSIGFLYQPAFCCDQELRGPAAPYCPQPGDIIFYTDYTIFWCVTHNYAGAGHPHHSGIIVRRPDGSLGAMEAGPYDTLHIRILDLPGHFRKYSEMGEPMWVRRRRVPLTCEQSAALTAWAMAQEGKRFALIRQGAQLTNIRCRGRWKINYVGHSDPNRCSYFCSELVTEALVAAGLIDCETARPCCTYPSDLFYGHSHNHYIDEHLDLSEWDPPARWLECPIPALGIIGVEAAPGPKER